MGCRLRNLLVGASAAVCAACSTGTEPPGGDSGFDIRDYMQRELTQLTTCDPATPDDIVGAKRDSLAIPPVPVTIDDRWAEISREVPGGWGGYFYLDATSGSLGRPTMYLVDPSQRVAAVEVLLDRGLIQLRDANVLQGRWSFAQLYDWRAYIYGTVGLPPGMTFSDIDELRNRLTFGMIDEAAMAEAMSYFEPLALPCDLVEFQVTGAFVIDQA